MKLRNYKYINESILDDYLSAVDGALTTNITTIEKEVTEKKFGVGIKSTQYNRDRNIEIETQCEKKLTASAKVQLLIDYIKREDELLFFDAMNEECWAKLERDSVVEFMGNIRLTTLKGVSNAVKEFTQLLSICEELTDKNLLDTKNQKKIKSFNKLSELQDTDEVPCILSFDGIKDYSVVAYLDKCGFRNAQNSITGNFTMLCKIHKKIARGESIVLTDIFKSFRDLPLNRQQRRKMISNKDLATPKEIADTIKGPAFVVIPIAIYK